MGISHRKLDRLKPANIGPKRVHKPMDAKGTLSSVRYRNVNTLVQVVVTTSPSNNQRFP